MPQKYISTKLAVLAAFFCLSLRADVGLVVYESKGVDARRTSTGHLTLISTQLCADGIDGVRTCRAGEEPGVAVTRYAGMAFGHDDWFIFALPLRDYFNATDDGGEPPVLSSGGTLEAMQMEYWRTHLRSYLPPLTQDQYQDIKREMDRFDFKRTLGKALTMELLVKLVASPKKKYPTEPIALIDPLTSELIPNGRWRDAVGAAHTRTSIIITAPASGQQEERLIPFVRSFQHVPFQAMSNNCSDFSKLALLQVFGDSGLHFHRRLANVADAWITSPLEVTSEFLRFAKHNNVPLTVRPMPMLAGTRYPTTEITSVTRGALVPNPQQGQLAFGLKTYIGWLNPFIGVTAMSLDKLARFANLRQLVHQRGGGNLSQLSAQIDNEKKPSPEELNALHREQVRVFGTTSCWKFKQDQFALLTKQAQEAEILTKEEQSLLLKTDRPFLLPRFYEKAAARQGQDGILMAGLPQHVQAEVGMSFLDPDLAKRASNAPPDASVPGRSKISEMANSIDPGKRMAAFHLMTALVNFDLSAEPDYRRSAAEFDGDWHLFLDVAAKNGLHLKSDDTSREPLQACSCREFDEGKTRHDAFGDAQRPWHELVRDSRTLVYGPRR